MKKAIALITLITLYLSWSVSAYATLFVSHGDEGDQPSVGNVNPGKNAPKINSPEESGVRPDVFGSAPPVKGIEQPTPRPEEFSCRLGGADAGCLRHNANFTLRTPVACSDSPHDCEWEAREQSRFAAADMLVRIGRGLSTSLANPLKFYGVTGVAIAEKWDRPCAVTLWGRLLDSRVATTTNIIVGYAELPDCQGSGRISLGGTAVGKSEYEQKVGATFRHPSKLQSTVAQTLPGGGNFFVRELRTCIKTNDVPRSQRGWIGTDSAKQFTGRIKGVRVRAAAVSPPSAPTIVLPTTFSEEAAQQRCKVWVRRVGCGEGKVATGMAIYTTNNGREIGAIALRCGRVQDGPTENLVPDA